MTTQPAGPTTPTSVYVGATSPTGPTTPTGPVGGSPEVDAFFKALDQLTIEAPISELEANEAITLFSVVNLLLGSMSRRRVGNEDKVDVLGILTLYYGLQDKSLPAKIALNTKELWNDTIDTNGHTVPLRDELKELRDDLDRLGTDVMFLDREAKRQFNLGLNNEAPGNVEFPRLFKRYVNIVTDPLLTLDIFDQDKNNPLADKEMIGKAYDLLQELKGLILQIVRSLSKYGTAATQRANTDWASLEGRALKVLDKVGKKRFTEDEDDRTPIAVVADLTDKPRDTVVGPYIVLARNGRRLLLEAMDTYRAALALGKLEDVDRQHLLDLFQKGTPDQFRTARMYSLATLIKRYPLANWG